MTFFFCTCIMFVVPIFSAEPYGKHFVPKAQEGGEIEEKNSATHKGKFFSTLEDIYSKKQSQAEKMKCMWGLMSTLTEHPDVLSARTQDDVFPLLFAFRKNDEDCVDFLARYEHERFGDALESMKRRRIVLYEAVKVQHVGMVKRLVEINPELARGKKGTLLISQLIVNCTASRLRSQPCCFFRPSAVSDPESTSYAIAVLLAQCRAHFDSSIAMPATAYDCHGEGCSYIRQKAAEFAREY